MVPRRWKNSSTRERLQLWEDPGLLFYFNSKHHRALLVQRKDIVLLSEFLLKKLETVVDLWNLDDDVVRFPFNRPQIFAAPALLRMFQFFWRSKFVLLDKYKKPINTFWQNHGNQRIARSVYCVQVTSDPPMDSATRAESLWFSLLQGGPNKRILYKNK